MQCAPINMSMRKKIETCASYLFLKLSAHMSENKVCVKFVWRTYEDARILRPMRWTEPTRMTFVCCIRMKEICPIPYNGKLKIQSSDCAWRTNFGPHIHMKESGVEGLTVVNVSNETWIKIKSCQIALAKGSDYKGVMPYSLYDALPHSDITKVLVSI